MKIISWNINHRTVEKPIPDSVIQFFEKYKPDFIVLNEYVDSVSREGFKRNLLDIGYPYITVSQKSGKQNQILVASKFETTVGDIQPPDLDLNAKTNFLHNKITKTGIEIVGFRAPWYKLASERRKYLAQLVNIINTAHTRKIVFIGDLNEDPFKQAGKENLISKFDLNNSFSVPNPKGEWSYISLTGKNRSCIDHAIISKRLKVSEAMYLAEYQGIQLAGSKEDNAISDHAVLSIDVEVLFH